MTTTFWEVVEAHERPFVVALEDTLSRYRAVMDEAIALSRQVSIEWDREEILAHLPQTD